MTGVTLPRSSRIAWAKAAAPFGHRNYRLFFGGQAISLVEDIAGQELLQEDVGLQDGERSARASVMTVAKAQHYRRNGGRQRAAGAQPVRILPHDVRVGIGPPQLQLDRFARGDRHRS